MDRRRRPPGPGLPAPGHTLVNARVRDLSFTAILPTSSTGSGAPGQQSTSLALPGPACPERAGRQPVPRLSRALLKPRSCAAAAKASITQQHNAGAVTTLVRLGSRTTAPARQTSPSPRLPSPARRSRRPRGLRHRRRRDPPVTGLVRPRPKELGAHVKATEDPRSPHGPGIAHSGR